MTPTYMLTNSLGQAWTVNKLMQERGVILEKQMTVSDWAVFSMMSESLDQTGFFGKTPPSELIPYALTFLNARDKMATKQPDVELVDMALAKIDVARGLTLEESYIAQVYGLTDDEKQSLCYILPRWKQYYGYEGS